MKGQRPAPSPPRSGDDLRRDRREAAKTTKNDRNPWEVTSVAGHVVCKNVMFGWLRRVEGGGRRRRGRLRGARLVPAAARALGVFGPPWQFLWGLRLSFPPSSSPVTAPRVYITNEKAQTR